MKFKSVIRTRPLKRVSAAQMAEKKQRLELVAATKGSLQDERSKIRLLVAHFLKGEEAADVFLES